MKFISNSEISKYDNVISSFKNVLQGEFLKGYTSQYASLQVPFDTKKLQEVTEMVKCYSDISLCVLIGIGGSNLGTLAILEAMYGKDFNSKLRVPLLNAETCDSYEMQKILHRVTQEISKHSKVLINCVSKSGGTTETIALFDILEQVMKSQIDYKKYIVCTTQKGSILDKYAKKKGYRVLHVEEQVGGRYSVFSPVGVFPMIVCGVDVFEVLQGAQEGIRDVMQYSNNDALYSALSIYESVIKYNCSELNLFFFVKQFESLGKWYRQLMGESLGKEFNLKGEKVHFGITPLVSLGSTDLHSMAQLFIGGPNRVHHQLVEIENSSLFSELQVSLNQEVITDIKGMYLQDIMNSIITGVKSSFTKRNIPYDEYVFEHISLKEIGKFMQYKMIEMMFLGHLFEVNPFNQPNVEEYKIETKAELKKVAQKM